MWAMWMLDLLPNGWIDFIINCAMYGGAILTIAGFIVGIFPIIGKYKTLLLILGIALLTTGVYFKGGHAERKLWQARVAEMEKKYEKSLEEARKQNQIVDNQVKKKEKEIEIETKVIVKEVIKYITPSIDETCKIPNEAIELYNKAAKGTGENSEDTSKLNEIKKRAKRILGGSPK